MSQYLHKPRTASLPLVLDGELLGQIDRVRATLRAAQAAERVSSPGLDAQAPRLERELYELISQAAESAVTFVVQALPGDRFDAIKLDHPPTTQMMEQYREQVKVSPWAAMPDVNPATMAIELLVECLVEPKIKEAELRELWAQLSKGEQNQLWNLAIGVQVEGANLPLFRAATATTGDGGEPSTTAANEEYR